MDAVKNKKRHIACLRLAAVLAAACAEQRPDVLFHYGNCGWEASATCHGWRKTEVNILVRTLFRSWRDVIAINGLDDVRFDPSATVIFCKPLEA